MKEDLKMNTLDLIRGRRPTIAIALVLGVLLLFAAAQIASAATNPPPVPGFESGNYCVDDYQPNSVCTANDVRITNIQPTFTDVCLGKGNGETASAIFTVDLLTGATERYNIGMFIAQDAGSAQTGNSCYHDVLQDASRDGPWDLFSGAGPFKDLDSDPNSTPPVVDYCGDLLQDDGTVKYTFQDFATITCIDANNDGVVDPVSTCTSWDNLRGGSGVACTSVKNAYPNTKSKCNCEPIDTHILIYERYDFGDLPDNTPAAPDYPTLIVSNGPKHALQMDANNDGKPETQGGIPAIWLGNIVDAETDGQPTAAADGDDLNKPLGLDDEDGIFKSGPQWKLNAAQLTANVSASDATACTAAAPCKLVVWIDWNVDGTFDQQLVFNVAVGANTLNFDPNADTLFGQFPSKYTALRARLYDRNYNSGAIPYAPTGVVANGEVEDYLYDSPLAVDLLPYSAVESADGVNVAWETVSETNNAGFNVYRAAAAAGPWAKLNAALIAAKTPGSSQGNAYSYVDKTGLAGTTYYYALEDVATDGTATRHDAISIALTGPNAVSLRTMNASSANRSALFAVLALVLSGLGLGFVWAKRH